MSTWSELTPRLKTLIGGWTLFLLLPGILAFVLLVSHQRKKRDEANQRDRDRMSEVSVVAGRTEPEKTPPPGHERDVAIVVKSGVYVDHIVEVEIVHSYWVVNFFVWFNWEGEGLTPGESFKLVNGEVTTRTLLDKKDDGNKHYVLYRAEAKIAKAFNVSRFPRDEHLLTIAIEDQAKQSYQLRFEADQGTNVSSRVAVPGYTIVKMATVVKPHSYASNMGAPWLPATYKATYSQFTTGISIARPSWGLYMKMYVGVYLAIAMAMAGLFIRGGGERVALASTALFVAIVNALTIASLIPDTGVATLADLVSNLGYVIISLLILQAIIYQRMFTDADQPGARLFDRVTIVLLTTFIVLLNVGVVLPL